MFGPNRLVLRFEIISPEFTAAQNKFWSLFSESPEHGICTADFLHRIIDAQKQMTRNAIDDLTRSEPREKLFEILKRHVAEISFPYVVFFGV